MLNLALMMVLGVASAALYDVTYFYNAPACLTTGQSATPVGLSFTSVTSCGSLPSSANCTGVTGGYHAKVCLSLASAPTAPTGATIVTRSYSASNSCTSTPVGGSFLTPGACICFTCDALVSGQSQKYSCATNGKIVQETFADNAGIPPCSGVKTTLESTPGCAAASFLAGPSPCVPAAATLLFPSLTIMAVLLLSL